jgi:hypothetical protein
MTDNASSNDLCINFTLQELLPELNSTERSQRRLRYYGHILNLACMAYLYGHDAESFEVEHMVNEILVREEEELKAWRRFGPLGKLHNLIVWVRRSDQRKAFFLSLSRAGEKGAGLMLIQDNSTRWNSVYDSVARAMKKQNEVQMFIIRTSYPVERDITKQMNEKDKLTVEDWRVLSEIIRILKPFKDQTMRLQSRAIHAHHGSLWEAFPSLKYLLTHIKSMLEQYEIETTPFNPSKLNHAVNPPELDYEIEKNRKHIKTSINNY